MTIQSFAANILQSQFSDNTTAVRGPTLSAQIIGGLTHSGGGHGSHGGGGGLGGKLVEELASNMFSSGNKPPQSQSYHGGPSANPQHAGGLAGSVMGGVAHMFGGQEPAQVGSAVQCKWLMNLW